jgi:glycosyltransferase involved in cell wall biosynthesis
MKNKTTFGGVTANPISGLIRKPSSVPNVFFLGSTSRALVHQRSLIPSKYLAKAKAANCGVMFGKYTKEVVDWADVVVLQRVGGRSIENLVGYCRLKGKATVYDIDDDVFNYPEAKEYETTDIEKVALEVETMMNLVDIVTVSEDRIKKSAEVHTINPIHTIQNYIDVEMWDLPKKKKYNQPDFLIGWAGGHFHSEDLKILEEPMRQILKQYPKVKFVTIGDKIDSLLAEFKDQVFFHEFVDVADFPDLMHKLQFSIGLAPLSHSKFSDARSNIRLLHYSLLSTPTIASHYGPYARSSDNNFPFFTVENTTEKWVEALKILIDDKNQREFLGKAAREAVMPKYRAERLVPKWSAAIRLAIELSTQKKELNNNLLNG